MVTPAKSWAPDRGDMIWIDFNPQAGNEMKNEHPMLVLSTKAFNVRTGIVIGLPMTHATYNETNPFAIKYMGPKKDVGYVLTHQPKSLTGAQGLQGRTPGSSCLPPLWLKPAKASTAFWIWGADAASSHDGLDHQPQHGAACNHLNHASLVAKQRDGSAQGQGR